MNKKYFICKLVLMNCLLLSACITAKMPEEKNVQMRTGEEKVFQISVSTATKKIVWYLDGEKVENDDSNTCTLVFTDKESGEHELKVNTYGPGGRTDFFIWDISVLPETAFENSCFKITIGSEIHETYGLSYPLTYRFTLPVTVSAGLQVFFKYERNAVWNAMPEKLPGDFFNGVTAARFDETGRNVFVSIPFSDKSDDIYIEFKTENGEPVHGISFSGKTDYYDNRKAVVTTTQDDWNDENNASFLFACAKQQERRIWFTPGIITKNVSDSTGKDIQEMISKGYVEPASHSRYHLGENLFCVLAKNEVGGSLRDIVSMLTLPQFNRMGGAEYVYAYLKPYGLSCDMTRYYIGKNHYLVSRSSRTDARFWAEWNDTDAYYGPAGFTIRMGTDACDRLEVLNGVFDEVYEDGGIYHLNYHPWAIGESQWDAYGVPHLDHIQGKKDIWYVSFGHLYVYHFMQERCSIDVTKEY